MSGVKTCTKCGVEKLATPEFFYKHSGSGVCGACKVCTRAAVAAKRLAKNPPKPQPVVTDGHKICPQCHLELPLEGFRLATLKGVPRYQSWCRKCEAVGASRRKRTPKQREKGRLERRARYSANPEKFRARARLDREQNMEKYLARSKACYQRHRDRRIEESRNRNAIRRNLELQGQYITNQEIAMQYGFQKSRCYYCGCDISRSANVRTNVDHYIPLARGGTNLAENIVIACKSCNNRKWAKMPWQFMPERFTELDLTPPKLPADWRVRALQSQNEEIASAGRACSGVIGWSRSQAVHRDSEARAK